MRTSSRRNKATATHDITSSPSASWAQGHICLPLIPSRCRHMMRSIWSPQVIFWCSPASSVIWCSVQKARVYMFIWHAKVDTQQNLFSTVSSSETPNIRVCKGLNHTWLSWPLFIPDVWWATYISVKAIITQPIQQPLDMMTALLRGSRHLLFCSQDHICTD